MTDHRAPTSRGTSQDRTATETGRAVEREAAEQAATADAVTIEEGSLPPGHPAHADDPCSVGETLSRDDALPAEAGRPGRPWDRDPRSVTTGANDRRGAAA
jgi:hypothetical protein